MLPTWFVLISVQTVLLQTISADTISAPIENLFLKTVANLPRKSSGNLIFLQENHFNYLLPKLSQIISYKLQDIKLQNLYTSPRNCILLSKSTAELNEDLFKYGTCAITVFYGLTYNNPNIKYFLEYQTNSAVIISSANNSSNLIIKTPYTKYKINENNFSILRNILKKPPTNLQKKSVRVTMFQKRFTSIKNGDKFIGFDGDILTILEQRLNFTTVMIKNDGRYGYQYSNGNFCGSLGDVIHGKADLATNSVFIKYYNSNDIQFTTAIMLEELCIAAPASEMIPHWMVVFLCFEPEVWFGILITFTIGGILWQILEKTFGKSKKFDNTSTWLNMAKILLQLSINGLYNRLWQRLYLLSLIIGSMILSKCLEGSLLDKLTRNSYKKDISTLEEMSKSSIKLYTLSVNLQTDTFLESSKLQSKFYVYPNISEDMVRLVNSHKDMAYLGRKFDLIRRIGEIRTNPRGVHIVEECPRSYNLAYMMRKDSYLYRPIETLLGRLLAVGIIDYLQNKDINATLAKNLSIKFRKNNRKYQPVKLRLQNLTIGILVLVFGYVISSLVFIGELFIKHISVKRSDKVVFIN